MNDPPLLGDMLRAAAARHPDRVAVVDGDRSFTHGELADRSAELADALRNAGVGTGTIVTFRLPNGADAIDLYRACWDVGGVAAPIHPTTTEVEVEALVARIRPVLHVGSEAAVDRLRAGGPAAPESPLAPRMIDPSLAVLLATSGSTGAPKLVAHTHRSLVHKSTQMPTVHGLDHHDVVLMPAPLAHMSGLLNGVLLPGGAGMACVTMARWRPTEALAHIEQHGVTFMVGPPTFFVGLIDDPEFSEHRVRSLRLISCGGGGVTPAFVRRASDRLGAVVKRTYGSTEAPTVTTAHVGDDPAAAARFDGRPLDGVELRIVDPTTGAPVAEGPGEVCIRGPELFAGYLADDGTIDAPLDAHGFFHSGDLGELTDGWLTITGRCKDLIIRGGENISASEVEQVLEAHPSIRHAAVVGRPDDRLGEVVAAFVVTDVAFDLEICQAWFVANGVSKLRTPEQVEVLDELPLLASGKVDKAALARLR